MADPVVEAVAPAPVAAPIATPAPAAPAAAEAAPAAQPATAAPVATQAEAAPTPAPVAAPASDAPTSILSEAKPDAPPPPVAATEPATPPPMPTYEAFKLPEGVTLDSTKADGFQKMLGQFEIDSKADHGRVQALGQQLIDTFTAEMQTFATKQTEQLVNQFNDQRKAWVDSFKADPVFGGQNAPATVKAAGALIEQYGGTAEEVAELRQALRVTGLGDHPAVIKLFARAGKALAQEGKPVPATVPKSPSIASKTSKRYANSLNGTGAS